jgi:alkylation response protein AidB-like acyl-CoA dehydrogenase
MTVNETVEEFFLVCRQALAAVGEEGGDAGNEVLTQLGWWELPAAFDDPEARGAMFALFRAAGRENADVGALPALLAAPYLDDANADGAVAAAITRRSLRRGTVYTLVGPTDAQLLLVDQPGEGVSLVPMSGVEFAAVDIPGRLTLREVTFDRASAEPLLDDAAARDARARSLYAGRVALAFDLVGAAEAAMDLAVEYSKVREQFGVPIGTFQAVRHILAWGFTDCASAAAAAELARDLALDPPERLGEVTKAIAGRNARRACQRSLQALGGIGFTQEHDHHLSYSRALALDSLLGTSAQLTRELGTWLKAEQPELGYASRALFA